jgi:small subunit ribosomal protein S11
MGQKKVVEKKAEETKEIESKSVAKSALAKKYKNVENVRIYINSTYNNTIITVTDLNGNVLTWASAGSLGFSGPKKATPFAASKVASVIAEKIKPLEIKNMEIYVKGIGAGRDSAIRSLAEAGFNIVLLKDVTPIPYNGPRPPKVRRV